MRILNKYNETDSATHARFKMMPNTDNFVARQLEKLKHQIEERNEKLKYYDDRILKINTGELDEELKLIAEQINAEINAKAEATKNKKIAEKTLKLSDQESSKSYYNIEKQGDRINKKWYYDSAFNYFSKASTSIPEYMKRELSRMPCNTGYIWKGVYCFGEKPSVSKTFTVTDNRKGMKIIYVWDTNYHSVYHKEGKNPEVRISHEKRKIKSN